MTEEIIIDGVDVAGCPDIKQYNDTEGNMMCMEYIDGSCEGHNCFFKQLKRLEQKNKELKEWKERVVKLFESACRCKYLNEETDICSYTNEKCININKCVYKYQELSSNYRSALEEIREVLKDWDNHVYNPQDLVKRIDEVLK